MTAESPAKPPPTTTIFGFDAPAIYVFLAFLCFLMPTLSFYELQIMGVGVLAETAHHALSSLFTA